MKCEICLTERTSIKHDFGKKIKGLKDDFSTWLYNCTCPVSMLDEITFIRNKELTFTPEEYSLLKNMKTKKEYWLLSNQTIGDDKITKMELAMDLYHTANRVESPTITQITAKEIHRSIWKLLYNKAKVIEKINNEE